MGIIGRDGREFRPRGEGEIRPRRSGGGRTPNMVGSTNEGVWITGPQTPYATTPRGGPLGKFGSPGMMGADDGRAPPRRDATNLNPSPPRKVWAVDRTHIYHGRMDTDQGRAQLRRGNHSNPSPHDIPPKGGTLEPPPPRPGH